MLPSFRLILLLCGVLIPSFLIAQWKDYTRFTREDGLPTNYVYGVVEDAQGIIWAYTEEGVARFNGKSFEVFNAQSGLPTNDVFLLLSDGEGRLFPGCFNCPAFYFEAGEWIIPTEENPPQPVVWPRYFKVDQVGLSAANRWSSLSQELETSFPWFEVQKGWSDRQIPFQDEADQRVRSFFNYDAFLRLKGRTANFLSERDSFSLTVDTLWTQLFNSKIHLSNSLYSLPKQLVAFYTEDLLLLLNLESGEQRIIPRPSGIPASAYFFLGAFSQGNIYLGSSAGFWEYNDQLEVVDSIRTDGLRQEFILTRPYKDRNGNLWLGSKDAGLFFFRKIDQQHAHLKTGSFEDNTVRFFREVSPGRILAVTDQGAIYEVDTDAKTWNYSTGFEHQGRLRYMRPFQHKGKTWWMLGLQSGIRFFQPETGELRQRILSIPEFDRGADLANGLDHVYDAERKVSYVLIRYKLLKWDHTTGTVEVLGEESPFSINLDTAGSLFSLRANGIYRHSPDTDSTQRVLAFDFDSQAHLSLSPQGQVWVYTQNGSLYYESAGTLKELQGFQVPVHTLFWENEYSLWAGTPEGIYHLKFSDEGRKEWSLEVFSKAHGLQSNNVQALWVTQDLILVGSDKGMDILDRSVQSEAQQLQPELHVRALIYGEKHVPLTSGTYIPYRDNDLTIKAELISYESQRNFHFAYRLSKSDSLWRTNGDGTIFLENLDPGAYQLQLKGVDAFGNESEVFEMPFRVQQVWYLQRRFLFLFAFLIIGLSVLISWYSSRRVIRKVSKEQEIRSRMHELKLQALRSQMNPHFIFNALGSIQYYIQTQEVDKADEYLSDFASLMRLILESAQSQMTRVEDEIELLRLYIRLEHIRFEEQFDFEIKVDPEIDPDFKIPSMLLQPFVENAINHGLYHLQGRPGKLEVEFTAEDDNTLLCRIEDNGIGREQARKLRKKGHRSRGMQLIQEQLESLQSVSHLQTQIETIDLRDENGQSAGTRVLLKLAYI
jgi:ligand-binding sensor domain-containing protein/two-component sensor histidine kinase